jgi:hypothetical protein
MSYASNVGIADRTIRLIAGAALLVLGLSHLVTGPWSIAVYTLGAIALITGLMRFWPAWSVLGINTCSAGHK